MIIDRASLSRLEFRPDKYSFDYDIGSNVVVNRLSGGLSRNRLDSDFTASRVSVTWDLNNLQYDAFLGFYNNTLLRGVEYFLLDLILDNDHLEEYIVKFMPGEFSMNNPRSLSMQIEATLEVIPNTANYYYAIVRWFEDSVGFQVLMDQLQQFANVDLDILRGLVEELLEDYETIQNLHDTFVQLNTFVNVDLDIL